MRIIGGKYRGKKLISPNTSLVRPTSDRAREALFNIIRSRLGNDLSSFCLADVFAGSGAFGLEALSQGFGEVLFVDVDTQPLRKNVALFSQEQAKIKVLTIDARQMAKAFRAYDVLFMDAPYQKGLTEPALQCLGQNGWLALGALCLIEVEKDEACCLPEGFVLEEERRYGLAKILIVHFVG